MIETWKARKINQINSKHIFITYIKFFEKYIEMYLFPSNKANFYNE